MRAGERQSGVGDSLNALVSKTFRIASYVAIAGISSLTLLTFWNVFLRYIFRRPIDGTWEYTGLGMSIVVSLALCYTAFHKDHVNVDIVISHLPKRIQAKVGSATHLVSIVILSLIAWQGIVQGEVHRLGGLVAGATSVPVFPFYYIVSLGCILMAIVLLIELARSLGQISVKSWSTWLALIIGGVVAAAPWWLPLAPPDTNPFFIGGIAIIVLFVVLFSGIFIGFGLALVGLLGCTYLMGSDVTFGIVKTVPYTTFASYDLSVLPLFVLMGELIFVAGFSKQLYSVASDWLGRLPGGLAMATIAACAGFAAVCGSSVATAVAMGTVSLPEMQRYGYQPRLSTGCVAAGGTLGILIPPSTAFILYGILTTQSIGKLFFAGIFPGILLAILFILVIVLLCRLNPALGPKAEKVSLINRLKSLKGIWSIVILFLIVMGGLYIGVFTPTEGGGVGAFGALVIALVSRRLTWQKLISALKSTASVTGMVFLILLGAMILGYFLTYTKMPFELAGLVSHLPLPPLAIFAIIVVIYLLLGCIMDSLAMLIITVPIFYPVIVALGFDPIWFGVIMVITMEAGLITPPVGVNVYVISGVAKDVPMYTIFRGIVPFLLMMVLCIIILTIFPQIALFLPNLMQ